MTKDKILKKMESILNDNAERITELEKENAELRAKESFVGDQNRKLCEQQQKIEVLEAENAELKEKLERAERARDYWKDSSFDWRHKCTSRRPFRVAVKAQKQLTKAKELLKEFVQHYKAKTIYVENMQDLLKQSEQFLSGVEK